ncbi:phosphatase PAP2 family protein [Streptomyces sp. NBC_01803]|uniref:phosphatase PAP2 family protein n=1 Tax=Streptomyces sp. NBC_01803 TaxID=2975946 RepID=UPI002DDAD17B|nr:phosphatase PAP2 family protein [Streptomyces sp. NBC_01803]WSA43096.1 phosphatase PAP2 family protein [Streptomyces sp. NBC_01803]
MNVRGRWAVGALWLLAGFLAVREAVTLLRRPAGERLTALHTWLGADGSRYDGGGPFPDPPFSALSLEPFPDDPGIALDAAWTVGILLLVAALGLVAARGLPAPVAARTAWLAPPAALCLLLVSRPVREALAEGRPGLLPVLLVLAGWLLVPGQRRGGVLIGVGAALQPVLLLFVPLLALAGRRRGAAGAAGAFAACTAVAWAALPGDSVTYWARHPAGAGLGDAPDGVDNQSLHGALLRLGLTGPGERALFLALAAAVCVLALRRAVRYARDDQALLAAAVVGCAALAVTPVAGEHQQVWILLAAAGRAGRRTADRPVWPVFAALVVTFEGTVLVPTMDSLAPIGENFPLIAALLAACAVRFLPRASDLWARPVVAGPAGRPNLLLELLLIRVGYFVYSWTRGRAAGDRATAEAHGHHVLDIQRFLRIDVEYDLNRAVAQSRWLADAMDFYYHTFHFAVPLTILGWLLVRHPAAYRGARRALAFTTLFGLAGFWLYPLAPPRLMPGLGFIDTANGPQDFDDPRYGVLTGISNPYAAMPSLHVGWSLWCALILWRMAPQRWSRVAGFAYPLLTSVVVMGTANHYLLDAVGGVIVVAGGFAASRAVGRALALQPAVPSPAAGPGPEPGRRAEERLPERV